MSRILIVDDDPDIRSLIRFKLRKLGHEVEEEIDGDAGLSAARRFDPDIVLIDWMMPRVTGVEMCTALRNDPAFADRPIILLTARAQDVDVEQGMAAGASDYITKPFSPRELVSRIQAALGATAWRFA